MTSTGKQRHRYGLLLVVLLTSYLVSAFLRPSWIGGLEVGLFTVAGLLALRNSPVGNRAGRLTMSAVLVVSVVMIVVSSSLNTNVGYGVASIWRTFLLLITAAVLIRQILLLPNVTIQSIYGAVSAYLIIGLMFAAVYTAFYYLHGKSFFADHQPGTPSTFQYFSFSTLTTLGYGDFTAAQPGGRAIAMIEAMGGQIFLATLVARLVAAFKPGSRPIERDDTTED